MTVRNEILEHLRKLHKQAFEAGDDLLLGVIDTAMAFAQGRSDDEVLMLMDAHGLIQPEEETEE